MRDLTIDWRQAFWLLCASLTFAIAGSIPFTAVDGAMQPVTRTASLAAAFALLTVAARNSGLSVTAAWRYFPPPLAGFLLWCAFTVAWSVSPSVTALRISESILTFIYFQSFMFVMAFICTSMRECARVIAVAFVATAVIGLLVNAGMFGDPLHFWVNPDVPERPRFTFGYLHPLATGDILAIGILAATFSPWTLATRLAASAGLFGLLLLSDSTGARFAILAIVPVCLLLSGNSLTHHAWRILACGAAGGLALLALVGMGAEIPSLGGTSAEDARLLTLTGRVQIWNAIFTNGLASTPFGYGFEAARYVIGPLMGRSYHAHNLYLNVLVETGAIGMVLFCALLAAWLWRLVNYGTIFPWALLAYALLLSISNPGMFTKQSMMFVFMLSYFLPAFYPRQLHSEEPRSNRLRSAAA
jgi:O-antigen ligase